MLFEMFAQAGPVVQVQPTDGLSGWFQVVIQLGALGLLAYLVSVIGPKHFREERDERQQRDNQFLTHAQLLQDKFQDRNALLIQHIEKQTAVLANTLEKQTGQLGQALDRQADKIERAVEHVCKIDNKRP